MWSFAHHMREHGQARIGIKLAYFEVALQVRACAPAVSSYACACILCHDWRSPVAHWSLRTGEHPGAMCSCFASTRA